jgi:antitoxin (DNA-binding transcriptional repressor) of toxin-antitoxin stability system
MYSSPVQKEKIDMAGVNVTALRQYLPAYLARVARGEYIRVTSPSRVIAESAPPAP